MEWIAINQARSKTGPIPRRWRDGRSLEREERERRPQSLEKRKPIPFLSRCNLSSIMF